jgi:hypothetical protein
MNEQVGFFRLGPEGSTGSQGAGIVRPKPASGAPEGAIAA